MRIAVLILLAALLLVGPTAQLASAADTPAVPGHAWQIDPVHSSIIWRISHNNGAGLVYGRFNSFSGMVLADPDNPGQSSVQITVDATSLDTAVGKRDDDLRSESYFNVAQFPSLTFASTAVVPVAGEPDTYDVTGDLTLLAVTKSITVRMKQHPVTADMKGNPVTGFEGSFSIKRSDFGMATGIPAIGDAVDIMLAFECKPAAASAQAAS